MTPETLARHFDLLTDAPNAAKKLRELVLQLAVQGKLVEQDSNDEPASVLLGQIEAEKQRLIEEKKIKKDKLLPMVKKDETPFEVPQSWQWVRLNEVCEYIQRGKGPKYVDDSNIPVVSQKCIQWDGFKLDRARFVDPESLEKYGEERFLRSGDLLWNSTGTGTIGRVNVYPHNESNYQKVVADSHVTVVRPIYLNSRFLYIFLASPYVQNEIENLASGTTKQIELNTSTVQTHPVPIAPLEEQKRIVAKVDELMGLIDRLEAQQRVKHEARLSFGSAALGSLLGAEDAGTFAGHWRRVRNNFDLLCSTPENVAALRKAVLQLAVQGKLVPQDPDDEPAGVLLERIGLQGERVVQKDTNSAPRGWSYTFIGSCIKLISGQHLKPDEYNEMGAGIPYLTGPADFGSLYPTATRWTTTPKATALEGDILLTVKGAGIGKTNILFYEAAAISRQLMAVRPILVIPDFISIVLKTAYDQFQNMGVGIAIPGISRADVINHSLLLPPLNEQKRIVAKVDELMGLVDGLEGGLTQARGDAERLLAAVVHRLQAA